MKASKAAKTSSCSTKDQKELRERELDNSLFTSNCASASDCTGTVVRGPQSDGVAKAYDEVYHYRPKAPDDIKHR